MAICKTCGALIRWAKTDAGKKMPVEPFVGGNVELIGDPDDEPIARVVMVGTGTHVSHFATCPQANQHRRSKR